MSEKFLTSSGPRLRLHIRARTRQLAPSPYVGNPLARTRVQTASRVNALPPFVVVKPPAPEPVRNEPIELDGASVDAGGARLAFRFCRDANPSLCS